MTSDSEIDFTYGPIAQRKFWAGLGLVLAFCCFGCDPNKQIQDDSQAIGGLDKAIFVTSNGWHSGIVVERSEIPEGLVPEVSDIDGAQYLEFGWGDRDFYQADEATFGNTLEAALVPTSAVLHVAALSSPQASQSRDQEVVPLWVDSQGFEQLMAFIDDSIDRSGSSRATTIGPGLYSNSQFYPATGSFHLFNTCNTWTAKALAAAGLDISPTGVITSDDLMRQIGM